MTLARIFKLFFLSFIPFLLLPGCDKDKPTIIKGTVTDRKTGKPIEKVSIEISGEQYEKDREGRILYTLAYCNTDANGSYLCKLDGKNASARFWKNNYLNHFGGGDVRDGEENIRDVSLVPRDGFLSLTIQNLTGQYDTIYALVLSPIKIAEERDPSGYSTKKYPLTLKKNESYTEVFRVASPDEVIIVWEHAKKANYLKKSVSVVPNDTASYTLTY